MPRFTAAAVLALALAPAALAAQDAAITPAMVSRIDSVFARYAAADGPGCALGVARRDAVVLERAWGSANLEFGAPITPQTIFEAGSVSKQFTAAAILLLAERGRLALSDDVRRYVPEVPDYGTPISIAQLLHHTSGLRDWGSLAAMGGWPRGSRAYTHAHVLEIIGRQRGLNNPPGGEYIYSNSNYNLLAIIAERVSGRSLPDFTRVELFEPLGLTRTGWRDNYTRIVPGRAQAYARASDGWRLDMPNEHIYGNSSLLTTVSDLLRWDAAVAGGRLGPAFLAARERRGRLTNGFEIAYAAGVVVRDTPGRRVIEHSGATAGYRADLARHVDDGWSIAVLCNAGDANPTTLSQRVYAIVSGTATPAPPAAPSGGVGVAAERLAAFAGRFENERDHSLLRLEVAGATLRLTGGPTAVMTSDTSFTVARSTAWLRRRGGRIEGLTVAAGGDTVTYLPAGEPADSARLGDYAGTYRSDEADVTVRIAVENGRLVVRRPPDAATTLTGLYRDGFAGAGTTFRFTRGRAGRVDGFGATVTRARNVRFVRVDAPPPGR